MARRLPLQKTYSCLNRAHLVDMFKMNLRQKNKNPFRHLLDFDVAVPIASKLDVKDSLIYECNPGAGVLTRALLNHGAKKVIGLECNRQFLPYLRELQVESDGRFMVEFADIGKLDVADSVPPAINSHKLLKDVKRVSWNNNSLAAKLVGIENGITAPAILLNLLLHMLRRSGFFSYGRIEIALLFSDDRAQRLLAQPGDVLYNRLAILAHLLCDVKLLHSESNISFDPLPAGGYCKPSLQKHLISLTPKMNFELKIPPSSILLVPKLLKLLTLKPSRPVVYAMESISPGSRVVFEKLGVDENVKPFDLTPSQYQLLFELFFNWEDSMLDFLLD